MPQMAPLSWVILFMAFIMLFGATINKLYYSSNKLRMNKSILKQEQKMNFIIWKW